jgi:hypothetical protein
MARGKELISARDYRMFERYYYWTEVKRLRFDDAIKIISNDEFFLSEGRVMQIIRRMIQEGAEVDGKKIEQPSFTFFRSSSRKPIASPRKGEVSGYHQGELFP